MTPEERKQFLESHRLAVVGLNRGSGQPQLSPVYYVLDGEELLISTTLTRAKAKAVRRDPRISVCVLGEQSPFPYLTVYGRARIEEEGAAKLMMRIGEKMYGRAVPDSMRPTIEERARSEKRVVLRVTPESYFP